MMKAMKHYYMLRYQSADISGVHEGTVTVKDVKEIEDIVHFLIVGKDFFRYRLEKVYPTNGKVIVLTHYITVYG